MIMEYLLLNHPLDCPVCDQAGECGLQDYSFQYGQSMHRFVEERHGQPAQGRLGPMIQLNQDRCIMCTRCVRFTREITQTGELQVMRRGSHAEIDIFPGEPVDNPLAGNVVDLCPVGALLDKDFLHKQRAWFLSKHDSICTRCSTGCNITAEENRGQLWRFKPRHNPLVNDYWICDEGRYSYKAANDPNLLGAMYVRKKGDLQAAADRRSCEGRPAGPHGDRPGGGHRRRRALAVLDRRGSVPACDLPEGSERRQRAGARAGAVRAGRTRPSALTRPRGGPATPALSFRGRSRSTRRNARTAAASRPILEHFEGKVIAYDELSRRAVAGEFRGLLRRFGRASTPGSTSRKAKPCARSVNFLVVEDTNVTPLAHRGRRGACRRDVCREGRLLRQRRRPPAVLRGGASTAGRALPDLDLLAILANRPGGGPVDSSTVLAELAEQMPAFSVAKGGKLPPHGLVLGGAPASADGRDAGHPSFTTPGTWPTGQRGAR